MAILSTTESRFVVGDDGDLLDFTLGEEEGEDHKTVLSTASFCREARTVPFPEFVEEELEWLSNKDAFPAVETCFGILSDNPELVSNHHSPVSVLENSASSSNSNSNGNNSSGSTIASCFDCVKVPTSFPVRARSNRRTRKRRADFGDLLLKINNRELSLPPVSGGGAGIGRRCLHCQVDKTPQWRAGPMGPKTLCNACGVRYKSGRLVPEYRPANSPTFSSALHSNSHRKVVEMRKKQQLTSGM